MLILKQVSDLNQNSGFGRTHGKYRGWNGSTVEISCWADLARPLAGIKTAQKTCAAISISLFSLTFK